MESNAEKEKEKKKKKRTEYRTLSGTTMSAMDLLEEMRRGSDKLRRGEGGDGEGGRVDEEEKANEEELEVVNDARMEMFHKQGTTPILFFFFALVYCLPSLLFRSPLLFLLSPCFFQFFNILSLFSCCRFCEEHGWRHNSHAELGPNEEGTFV